MSGTVETSLLSEHDALIGVQDRHHDEARRT